MYLGTSRVVSKRIALIFIIIGVIMLPDVIAPTFTDAIVNVPLAFVIADTMSIGYIAAFILTYVIAVALILFGFLIYPYNTKKLANGKLKMGFRFIMRNPWMLVLAIIIFIIVLTVGQTLYDTVWLWAKATMGLM